MSILPKLLLHPELKILIHIYVSGPSRYSDLHAYTSGRGATHRAVRNLLESKLIIRVDRGVYAVSDLGAVVAAGLAALAGLLLTGAEPR